MQYEDLTKIIFTVTIDFMNTIQRYLFLTCIASILAACSASPPPAQQEQQPQAAVTAPQSEPQQTAAQEPAAPNPIKEPEATAKQEEPAKPAEPIAAAPIKEAKPVETAPAAEKEQPVKSVPAAKIEEPVADVKQEHPTGKDEIIAQFEGVTITKETYDQTKTEIEKVVDQLNRITAAKDYNQWITFLSDEYKQQYSQPATLKTVSEALPVKGIKLKSLKDYFTYVFVLARQNVRVDDINFVSPTRVNVIMKQGNVSLLIYCIENVSGNWKLIPPKL